MYNIETLYKARNSVIKFSDDYSSLVSKAKFKAAHGKGLKILIPKQMLQRLPLAIAQIKADNTWFPPKKLIQIPGLSKTFFHFFQVFFHQSSRTFPGLLTKFQDLAEHLQSCSNSKNKISFLQNKNIHPIVNNSSFYSENKNKNLS